MTAAPQLDFDFTKRPHRMIIEYHIVKRDFDQQLSECP